ncbi:hypothetical protein BY458DRAFT_559204 [Sporodiniella umbellata]|nr:hypothetical protein BY458DRAFT_559204 [Sporodiniella umbellata]
MSSADSMKYYLKIYKLSAKKETEMKSTKTTVKDVLGEKNTVVVKKNVPLIRRRQVNRLLVCSARLAKRAAAQVEQEAKGRRARLEEGCSQAQLKRKREDNDKAEERPCKRLSDHCHFSSAPSIPFNIHFHL